MTLVPGVESNKNALYAGKCIGPTSVLVNSSTSNPDIHSLWCTEMARFCLPNSFAFGSMSASNYFLECMHTESASGMIYDSKD